MGKAPEITSPFFDSPSSPDFEAALIRWTTPPLPTQRSPLSTAKWLYAFIRLNIKRGRIFDLREVLETGKADCLGYCKIMTVLARQHGLDAGVVDVVIDNRGLAVPHTVVLVNIPNAPFVHLFIDFWYGSTNIHHQVLGLRVKCGAEWELKDVEAVVLGDCDDFTYLPDFCVDGITLYIEGNRSLKNGGFARAIQQYGEAIKLYPLNARVYYNRAIAHEKLGKTAEAQADYAQALATPEAVRRTLATQPQETVDLIQLDERGISERDQQVFLFYHGFVTGRRLSAEAIAQRLGIEVDEVRRVLKRIDET